METEEQQVEQIKAWWAEHGRGIIAGLVIGFALFYGWQYYDNSVRAGQEAQAEQYAAIIAELEQDAEAASGSAQTFIAENGDAIMGQLAAFELARAAIQNDDLAQAASLYQGVREQAEGAVKGVAAVREARVRLAQQDFSGALDALTVASTVAGFEGMSHELRGDVLQAQGDLAGARSAYQAAIDTVEYQSQLAEIKLKSIPADS